MSPRRVPHRAVSPRFAATPRGLDRPACHVIAGEDAFHAIYGAAARDLPDFRRELLLAVHRGVCRSGGYGVAVEEVALAGGALHVRIRTWDPPPGAFVTLALTQPAAFAAVRRRDLGEPPPGEVVFTAAGQELARVLMQLK